MWTPQRIFLSLFTPIALGAAYVGSRDILRERALVARAATTTGAVIETQLIEQPCSGVCKSGPTYRPRVAFRYAARGVPLFGSQVTSLGESGTSSWAEALLRRYKSGQQVTVYYDTADPAVAWLERSALWPQWLIAIAPMLVVGVFGVALGARRRGR
jgi:hypothetical protein